MANHLSNPFHDATKQYPLLRVCFALASLTRDKVEDGISRLLIKSDFLRIAAKNAAAEVAEVEQILQDGLDIVDRVCCRDDALAALGQFFVRIALKVAKKEKMGREGVQRDMDQIKALFLKDVGTVVGKKVEYSAWDTKHVQITPKVAAEAASSSKSMVATLADHSNASWAAEQHGFTIGQNVVKKGTSSSDPESVFVVFSIDDSKTDKQIQLKQTCTFSGQLGQVTLDLATLLKEWSPSKADIPIKMTTSQQRSDALAVDVQKSIIFQALIECERKSAVQSELVLWRKPDSVRAGIEKIPEGALVLVPIMPLMNVSTRSSATSISFGKFNLPGHLKKIEYF